MSRNKYWQGKERGSGQYWKHAAIYTAGFCALSLAIVLPLYKTNHTLVWKIDSLGQYYPAFLYIGKWLRNIFASVTSGHPEISFFDPGIGMGEDVIGSLNYYGLGDPLNLLAALANAGNDAVLFSLLYFLRLYLAGAAFLVYSEYLGFAFQWSALGAYLYTFFGYGLIAGTMYPQFLTPLITFPLVLLGCEKILHHEKPWTFVLRTDIHRANTMFCAIELPAGSHDIILQYVPSEFYAGCLGAAAAVILMVIQPFLSPRVHKKAQSIGKVSEYEGK